jgi:hypothetical protein
MGLETIHRKENEIRKDISKGYNEYKEFEAWVSFGGIKSNQTQNHANAVEIHTES